MMKLLCVIVSCALAARLIPQVSLLQAAGVHPQGGQDYGDDHYDDYGDDHYGDDHYGDDHYGDDHRDHGSNPSDPSANEPSVIVGLSQMLTEAGASYKKRVEIEEKAVAVAKDQAQAKKRHKDAMQCEKKKIGQPSQPIYGCLSHLFDIYENRGFTTNVEDFKSEIRFFAWYQRTALGEDTPPQPRMVLRPMIKAISNSLLCEERVTSEEKLHSEVPGEFVEAKARAATALEAAKDDLRGAPELKGLVIKALSSENDDNEVGVLVSDPEFTELADRMRKCAKNAINNPHSKAIKNLQAPELKALNEAVESSLEKAKSDKFYAKLLFSSVPYGEAEIRDRALKAKINADKTLAALVESHKKIQERVTEVANASTPQEKKIALSALKDATDSMSTQQNDASKKAKSDRDATEKMLEEYVRKKRDEQIQIDKDAKSEDEKARNAREEEDRKRREEKGQKDKEEQDRKDQEKKDAAASSC